MRFLLQALALVTLLVVGGFFVFVASLPRAETFDVAAAASRFEGISEQDIGIVALTGGGGDRIRRAVDLLKAGVGERVLISGTHPEVSKADLATPLDADMFTCCVDLGFAALNTIGNGVEAANWAAANEYEAIWLVTHDFHLPRALLEVRDRAPHLKLIGVPVRADTVPANGWVTSPRAWQVLTREYGKLLLSLPRTLRPS